MTLQTIAICLFAAWCVITIGAVLLARHLDRTRDAEIRRRNLARRIGGKRKPRKRPTDWNGEAQG